MSNLYFITYLLAQLPKVDFSKAASNTLRAAFMIVGLLSVIFIALGGFKYVTSAGDPQGTQKAKNTILYALVGLVVAISANVLINFVMSRI